MTHHVVVSVDVVSTPVLLSARVEAGIVLQPALGVVHTHLSSNMAIIASACHDNMVAHLDRAGIPGDSENVISEEDDFNLTLWNISAGSTPSNLRYQRTEFLTC